MALGRFNVQQQVNYFRFNVAYNDTGIAAGVLVGYLPKGAQIVDIVVLVTTAFNAATTNNLLLGTSAAGNQLATTSDTAAGSTGAKRVTTGLALTPPTGDQAVYVAYTQTGTAATAGAATVSIMYTIDMSSY